MEAAVANGKAAASGGVKRGLAPDCSVPASSPKRAKASDVDAALARVCADLGAGSLGGAATLWRCAMGCRLLQVARDSSLLERWAPPAPPGQNLCCTPGSKVGTYWNGGSLCHHGQWGRYPAGLRVSFPFSDQASAVSASTDMWAGQVRRNIALVVRLVLRHRICKR